jgi:hypothetical protein
MTHHFFGVHPLPSQLPSVLDAAAFGYNSSRYDQL